MANGIPFIPATDKFAGLRQGLMNLVQGRESTFQRQQAGQQLAQLFPNLGVQGITNPLALQGALGLGLQQNAQQFDLAQTLAGQRPTIVPQGGTAISPSGQKIFESPRPQAGRLQTARAGDNTGLAEGTVFQADKEGNVKIIAPPDTLTFDEQRKRDLIAGGLEPKEISALEKRLTGTQIQKNRAEIAEINRKAGGKLSPEENVQVSSLLRKEFDSLSKDFRTIRDSFVRLNAAAEDPSAAGDIALIFNFMKILDPGSVVRESEFATAENAAGVPAKIRNMWNKALDGERLTANRQDFINTANNIMKSQQGTQRTRIKRYTDLANRFNVAPQDVITEVQELTPFTEEPTTLDPQFIPPELQPEVSDIDKRIAELEAIK